MRMLKGRSPDNEALIANLQLTFEQPEIAIALEGNRMLPVAVGTAPKGVWGENPIGIHLVDQSTLEAPRFAMSLVVHNELSVICTPEELIVVGGVPWIVQNARTPQNQKAMSRKLSEVVRQTAINPAASQELANRISGYAIESSAGSLALVNIGKEESVEPLNGLQEPVRRFFPQTDPRL